MRIRDWDDLLSDVIESDVDPSGWRAVGGDRAGGVGEDLFIGHPQAGAYQLKTYAKNPYQVEGVGSKVARRVDEDIEPLFPTDAGGVFGVQQPIPEEEAPERAEELETVLETHADAPTTPEALFEDVMETLDSPAYGPMEFDPHDRPEGLDELTATFEDAQQALEAEFDELVDETVTRGFE